MAGQGCRPSAAISQQPGEDGRAADRLPSLDGWRAVSILLVLASHCRFVAAHPGFFDSFLSTFLFDGDLGVRCFFLISGLLITWLMLAEHDRKNRVDLRQFYIRRALRILPVCFAYLGVLFCLQCFTPFSQSRAQWISNVTFTTNFVNSTWPSGHLWSLSVEEQFYLIWPALFVFLQMGRRPSIALRALLLPILIAPVWRMLSYKGLYAALIAPLFSRASFFNYFDCLAFGCICAVLLRHKRELVEGILLARPALWACMAAAMILFSKLMILMPIPGRVVVATTYTLQSVGMAVLMLQSVLVPCRGVYRGLNWRWMQHIGRLSYSIYIWQQLFCTSPSAFGLDFPWWMTFPGWLLTVFVVAHISYFALERPVFQLRARFR